MSSVSQVAEAQAVSGDQPRQFPRSAFTTYARTLPGSFAKGLAWIMRRLRAQQARKTLRICESLPLGDRRFVAVIQVDQERFLIGYSSSSVSMLARLHESKTFAEALEKCQEAGNAS